MPDLPSLLVVCGRAGAARDATRADHLVLTRQIALWKAWIGFNASRGLAANLSGLVCGYPAALALVLGA